MTTILKTGRKPGIISYTGVKYNEKEYVVGIVIHNNEDINFVFDKDDFEKVSKRAWHVSARKYIGSTFYTEDERLNKKELFLHNLVMNRLEWYGKGAKETIDHINRNGFDNRKENLRLISQTQQNMNQIKRERSITLPADCGITPEQIPRHIWYIKPQGAHGDRFAIEFKTEGLCWKTTSSKNVSLKDKLQAAKEKLEELYKEFPQLNPFNPEKLAKEEYLRKSFEDILALATKEDTYNCDMCNYNFENKQEKYERIEKTNKGDIKSYYCKTCITMMGNTSYADFCNHVEKIYRYQMTFG